MIAAIDRKGGLGFENKLLFRLPDDLKHFKGLTTGHTVLMGRRTFESLPGGALPKRRNVVLTHSAGWKAEGVEVYSDLCEALAACATDEEVFVIGGASVYEQAMPRAERLLITHVEAEAACADVYFPPISEEEWMEVGKETHGADERHEQAFSFVEYVRRKDT